MRRTLIICKWRFSCPDALCKFFFRWKRGAKINHVSIWTFSKPPVYSPCATSQSSWNAGKGGTLHIMNCGNSRLTEGPAWCPWCTLQYCSWNLCAPAESVELNFSSAFKANNFWWDSSKAKLICTVYCLSVSPSIIFSLFCWSSVCCLDGINSSSLFHCALELLFSVLWDDCHVSWELTE